MGAEETVSKKARETRLLEEMLKEQFGEQKVYADVHSRVIEVEIDGHTGTIDLETNVISSFSNGS